MVDPDLCIGRFDVHMDTIIRTKESLKLKAIFLDEKLKWSIIKNVQLCVVDTENCDVFIFEEKVKGTCFLFQCGPPEDFRCKFTRHANYTSARDESNASIRATDTIPSPSGGTTSILCGTVWHEMELVSLKGGKNLHGDENISGNSTQGAKNAAPVETTTAKNAGCSRFQFACHSGECLAVYNACDGIPQCEDGSDEGPECPTGQKTSGVAGAQQNSQNTQQMQDLSNALRLLHRTMPMWEMVLHRRQCRDNIRFTIEKIQ
ncbi:LOW QUALITY PROTEIN: low-density lipoprotein receptor-related protein 11-like [Phlebotomus papatasi]|uniref:LOW QUALITY PROTEIN: low-density lipoprotein receptor-related protein 11-like n=1 Tax=Phlebotomus papatasi TaxID=29031 RepID=UPI002484015B|nr:LOW QUALITY PROTEIN: low-density lipoprotein receptor-related protein 11-like [Phlebotomus papatasi]